VFSTTLTKVEGNARLVEGDIRGEIATLTEQPGNGIVSVGGATFAAHLARLNLIDEYRLFINPVVLGGGTPYFPTLTERINLDLIETKTFSQVSYLRYRPTPQPTE
jgi:dihydrofolate reductase